VGTLSLGAIISPLLLFANTDQNRDSDIGKEIDTNKPQTISILQTTDVHSSMLCFVENF
jgi:hypothetical protein